jgi:hypothetical protein
MRSEQILIGVLVAVVCAAGLWNGRWFLEKTRKGQWLARRFGEETALWVLRGLLSAGTVFGVLLALGVVNPVQW